MKVNFKINQSKLFLVWSFFALYSSFLHLEDEAQNKWHTVERKLQRQFHLIWLGGSEHSLTNTLITASNNNVTYIRIAFILGDPGTVWSAPQRFFALSSSLRDETKNGCEASFQVSSLFNIYENYLQSNLTDLHVAKNNRGRPVSQVLNITNGKKWVWKKTRLN